MTNKIRTVMGHIKLYMGYYTTIATVIGILWTVFILFDKWKDNNTQVHNDITMLILNQKLQRRNDSILIEQFILLDKKTKDINNKIDVNIKDFNILKRSYLRYLSQDEALSKVDFIRFIQEIYGDSNIIYMYPYLLPKKNTTKSQAKPSVKPPVKPPIKTKQ